MGKTSLRKIKNCKVVNELINTEELQPFIPAWNVIQERFDGIGFVDNSLDPVYQVHELLTKELNSNNLLTEDLFLTWLLGLSFIGKNIVCKNSGLVWEPIMEPISDFLERSSTEIIVTDALSYNERIDKFNMWVIQLCDWEGFSSQNNKMMH